jgi:hypothetical protein
MLSSFVNPHFSAVNTTYCMVDHMLRHKTSSQVLESAGKASLDGAGDFELQHNSYRNQDTVDEIYLLTLEELLRPRRRDFHRSLPRASCSLNAAYSILVDICDSQGSVVGFCVLQCRLFWHVVLDILHGLTCEILDIRSLLIDRLNASKNQSPTTPYG